jgi:hypothetical protein
MLRLHACGIADCLRGGPNGHDRSDAHNRFVSNGASGIRNSARANFVSNPCHCAIGYVDFSADPYAAAVIGDSYSRRADRNADNDAHADARIVAVLSQPGCLSE